MENPTDYELLRRMRDGDTGALGILYMRYAGSVSDFAFSFIRVTEDVEDITHNIFCSLWENRDRIADVESMKSYLFMMTRNAIFKVFRHQKVVEEWESEAKRDSIRDIYDGESKVTTDDLLEMIDLMIANMPEMQRKIFCMSRYENMTYNEIADKLGVSPKTVQRYIGLALADLRKLMQVMLIFMSMVLPD